MLDESRRQQACFGWGTGPGLRHPEVIDAPGWRDRTPSRRNLDGVCIARADTAVGARIEAAGPTRLTACRDASQATFPHATRAHAVPVGPRAGGGAVAHG